MIGGFGKGIGGKSSSMLFEEVPQKSRGMARENIRTAAAQNILSKPDAPLVDPMVPPGRESHFNRKQWGGMDMKPNKTQSGWNINFNRKKVVFYTDWESKAQKARVSQDHLTIFSCLIIDS
jgi:hypothetical protein